MSVFSIRKSGFGGALPDITKTVGVMTLVDLSFNKARPHLHTFNTYSLDITHTHSRHVSVFLMHGAADVAGGELVCEPWRGPRL